MLTLDAFDLRILVALQQNARTPMSELAEHVGLSAPACYRRIRSLRESRAIEREIALVSPSIMGWPITMVVLLKLESDRARIVDDLIARLRAAEEVLDVWLVTGEHDMVLLVAAKNMSTYDAFTRRVLHADESVRSFKTLVVLQHPKRAAPLPQPR
jgi:Lrp/AsnC family leucine-responsive transcriptional regulator